MATKVKLQFIGADNQLVFDCRQRLSGEVIEMRLVDAIAEALQRPGLWKPTSETPLDVGRVMVHAAANENAAALKLAQEILENNEREEAEAADEARRRFRDAADPKTKNKSRATPGKE